MALIEAVEIACIAVAAFVMAADEALRRSEYLSVRWPRLRLFGSMRFIPAASVLVAAAMWIGDHFRGRGAGYAAGVGVAIISLGGIIVLAMWERRAIKASGAGGPAPAAPGEAAATHQPSPSAVPALRQIRNIIEEGARDATDTAAYFGSCGLQPVADIKQHLNALDASYDETRRKVETIRHKDSSYQNELGQFIQSIELTEELRTIIKLFRVILTFQEQTITPHADIIQIIRWLGEIISTKCAEQQKRAIADLRKIDTKLAETAGTRPSPRA
jgi:hypothetical protein